MKESIASIYDHLGSESDPPHSCLYLSFCHVISFTMAPFTMASAQFPFFTLQEVPTKPPAGVTIGQYKAKRLLTELRRQASPVDKECVACIVQNKATCCHLNKEQCGRLRAAKRVIATKEGGKKTLYVFDCGHVYRDLVRISRDIRGRKERSRGMCVECWRNLVSDGRRMRVACASPAGPYTRRKRQ